MNKSAKVVLALVSKSAGNQNATLIHYRAPAVEHQWDAPQSPQITEVRRFTAIPRARMPASRIVLSNHVSATSTVANTLMWSLSPTFLLIFT